MTRHRAIFIQGLRNSRSRLSTGESLHGPKVGLGVGTVVGSIVGVLEGTFEAVVGAIVGVLVGEGDGALKIWSKFSTN